MLLIAPSPSTITRFNWPPGACAASWPGDGTAIHTASKTDRTRIDASDLPLCSESLEKPSFRQSAGHFRRFPGCCFSRSVAANRNQKPELSRPPAQSVVGTCLAMATGACLSIDPYALSMAAFQAGDVASFTWLVERHRD